MKLRDNAGFDTICIHAGQTPDPSTGAIITPIYQTSTYVQDALGEHKGYEYGRTQNPTRAALEGNLAAIENGRAAFAFASGMAATAATMRLLQAGDHVVVTDNTYGGTYRFFERVLRRYQLDFSYVDTSDTGAIERAMRPATKMLFLETPTNPTLRLTDLAAAIGGGAGARRHGGRGQHLRQPVRPAAARARRRPRDAQHDQVPQRPQRQRRRRRRRRARRAHRVAEVHPERRGRDPRADGCVAGAARHQDAADPDGAPQRNAMALAEFLDAHPKVAQVHYPGLPSHPEHALAKRQMRGFGGLITFELGSLERARTLLNSVRLMALAESLGGVETLISHPATMTHAAVPLEHRNRIGLTDDMVRVSVGIEDVDDLIADLAQALERV